jgi:hypothetical protein
MAQTLGCPFCAATQDNWRYSLLDCTTARCVWALVDDDITEHISINKCGNAKDWIFFLIDTLSHEKMTMVIVTLWAIWSARRKAIHEDIFQSLLSIYSFIIRYLAELELAQSTKVLRMQVNSQTQAATWMAPSTGHMKINVDAAVSRHGNRGVVAAICRDEAGAYVGARF